MTTHESTSLTIDAGDRAGRVSAIFERPRDPRALCVLAHGAGAGMQHPFLQAVADGLAERQLATLRYQFPYMEARQRRPDPPAVLVATVAAAVRCAAELAPGLPLLAGGKSLGARMTSTAQAAAPLPGVRGLVFLGFPLHPPGRPDIARAAHLDAVRVPMLFLQGTRDDFARLDLLLPLCRRLGAHAELRLIDGADHSFAVLKRSGRTPADVLTELLDAIASWSAEVTRDR
jgi:predicted alpha/beta-hydrolase family hydrolase